MLTIQCRQSNTRWPNWMLVAIIRCLVSSWRRLFQMPVLQAALPLALELAKFSDVLCVWPPSGNKRKRLFTPLLRPNKQPPKGPIASKQWSNLQWSTKMWLFVAYLGEGVLKLLEPANKKTFGQCDHRTLQCLISAHSANLQWVQFASLQVPRVISLSRQFSESFSCAKILQLGFCNTSLCFVLWKWVQEEDNMQTIQSDCCAGDGWWQLERGNFLIGWHKLLGVMQSGLTTLIKNKLMIITHHITSWIGIARQCKASRMTSDIFLFPSALLSRRK